MVKCDHCNTGPKDLQTIDIWIQGVSHSSLDDEAEDYDAKTGLEVTSPDYWVLCNACFEKIWPALLELLNKTPF